MDIGSFKRDSAAVEAGQWVEDIPQAGDLRLKVRGLTSPSVRALTHRLERAVSSDQRERDGSLKPDAALGIFCTVLAREVLMDWENLSQGGKAVSYDQKLAEKWLTDPDMAFFADAVTWAARIVDKAKAEQAEASEGN